MANVGIYSWDGSDDSIPFAVKDETTNPITLTVVENERKVFDETDPVVFGTITALDTEYPNRTNYSGNPSSWPPPKPF